MNNTNKDKSLSFTVDKPCGLLDFLFEAAPEMPKKKIKAFLTHGQITVNGRSTTKYNYGLKNGDNVRVSFSIVLNKEAEEKFDIIYEDDDIIVINKSAGLLTVGTDKEELMTAFHLLGEYVRQSNRMNRVFVVHRLDRDTSGVVVFAKNEKMKLALQEHWDELVETRNYLAIVEGRVESKSGQLRSWLKENTVHIMYSSKTDNGGKLAITNYKVLKQNDNYTLLDIQLETGRKNQIRVQMKDMGHPVVGDRKYGGKGSELKRLGLHSNLLVIHHPVTGEVMRFEAQPPKKFISFVKNG